MAEAERIYKARCTTSFSHLVKRESDLDHIDCGIPNYKHVRLFSDDNGRTWQSLEECSSCGDMPEGECPKSLRPCGHHCNCSWVHDCCHWCNVEFGEDGAETPMEVPA